MMKLTSMPRLKGFRSPRKVVAYAVWAYHRFALSTADVEDLLAERGVIVSREAIRHWMNRFGPQFAARFRRDRPRPNDKWHMDEVVVLINGVKHWLWRAIDANGDVLDILIQPRSGAKAARRFFGRVVNTVNGGAKSAHGVEQKSSSLGVIGALANALRT